MADLKNALDTVIGQQRQDQAHANLQLNADVNPDDVAKRKALASRWGVGIETATHQQPLLERAAVNEDNTTALRDAPKSTAFIADDPTHAALVRDQVGEMARIEGLIAKGYPMLRPTQGPQPTVGSYLSGLGTSFTAGMAMTREAVHMYAADMFGAGQTEYGRNAARRFEQAKFRTETSRPDFKSWLAGSVYGGASSTLQAVPAIGASVLAKSPAPALMVMGGQTGLQTYGDVRTRGGTANEALAAGVGTGTVEAATELLPMGFLVKRFGKTGFKSFVSGMLGRELPSEQVATFLQDAIDTAVANPDKTWGEFWAERPEAAANTAVATVVQAGAMGGASKVASHFAHQDAQAEAAKPAVEQFDEVVKATSALPLRERDPAAFHGLMEKLSEGMDVHVSAEAVTTYLQSVKPEEAEAMVQAMGIKDQLDAATKDTDIVIKGADYLAYVGPTEAHAALKNDIRIGPAGMSINEATTYQQDREAMLADAAAKTLGQGVDLASVAEPKERVRQHAYEMAIAGGRPEAEAQAYATIQASHAEARAARNTRFTDPWAAYAEANPSLQKGGTTVEGPAGVDVAGGETFSQGSPTGRSLTGMLKRSTEGALRGLVDQTGKLHVWPAEEATHHDKAKELGIPYDVENADNRVWVHNDEGDPVVDHAFGVVIPPEMLRDTSVYFRVPGAGVLNGPEYYAWLGGTFEQKPLTALEVRQEASDRAVSTLIAEQYRADHGITTKTLAAQAEPDETVMQSIADEYDRAKHDPEDPLTKAAYAALVAETLEQFKYMGGVKVEAWDASKGDTAYASSGDMTNDVFANGHMWFYPTEAETFGSSGALDETNPMLADSGYTDVNGRPLLVNDIFRVVHDFFGHTQNSLKFGPKGELNAFLEHAGMYSKDALPALAAETLMQNAWVNYGKHLRNTEGVVPKKGEPGYVAIADRKFADQKAFAAPQRIIDRAFQLQDRAEARARDRALLESYNRFRESQGLARTSDRIEPIPGKTGRVTLTHWGKRKGLKALDPGKWGENWEILTSSEKAAIGEAPNRTYYGLSVDEGPWGYEAEYGLGPNRYETSIPLNQLYDFAADPEGLTAKAEALLEDETDDRRALFYEAAIQQAGYKGYWVHDKGMGLVAAVFEKLPVKPVVETFEQNPNPDSKVPGVVYHGTLADFEKFDLNAPRNYDGGAGRDNTDTGWFGKGLYFTPSGKVAGAAYANREGGNVIPAYLDLKNPIEIDIDRYPSEAKAMSQALAGLGRERDFTKDDSPTAQTEWAKSQGYDGVIVSRNGKPEEIVVFDPEQISSAITGNRMAQGPRGDVSFSKDGALIRLFKSANASTLVHETTHIWLEELARDAAHPEASQELVDDFEIVKRWWRDHAMEVANTTGMDQRRLLKAIANFGKGPSDLEAIRPFHELFARAGERYLMEGKAPSQELRGAFAKFRQWLVAIYKDFTALKVPMTNDLRGVFDRLVAVPEAIDGALTVTQLQPFFADPGTAGMSQEEFDAYLKTIQLADEAGHDRLLGKVMGDIRRQRTAEWKSERDVIIAELTEELDATPEMVALSMLEQGGRISRSALEEAGVNPDTLYRNYVANKGLHPDLIAEQAGLSSGEALIELLTHLKTVHDQLRETGDTRTVKRAMIEEQADDEMIARHGDILNDGTIGDEAVAAINELRRSEVLMTEVRALVRKAGAQTAVWSEEEMQRWAKAQIAKRDLGGIRPHVYEVAEAKAGRDALKALVKDDFAAALDAKFRQLLNMHLYRAARTAREEIEKGKKLFNDVAKARNGTISKTRDMDMVGAARQIIGVYGFVSGNNDADYMAKVEMYDPDLWADIGPTVTAAIAGAKPIDDLTYDEFVSLRDVVRQLWLMSRISRQMEVDFQALETQDIVDDLSAQLDSVRAPVVVGPTGNATEKQSFARLLSGVRAHMRRVESWVTAIDGGPKGPFRTYVWQSISEAATRYRIAKADYNGKLLALLEPMRASLKRGKIEAPELGPSGHVFGAANNGIGKSELLHAILHTGNESNKRKLLLGRGWATEINDVLDTSRWDSFVARMHAEGILTKADYDFAQSIWDLLEETKPAAQAAHRKVFGRYFEEVTANEVVTPFGVYKGGYVPALTDTFFVQEQALRAGAEAITEGSSANMFPSPARGFTKSRVEYNAVLALDLAFLPQHIDKVLKFSHLTGPVRDVLRLLKDRGFAKKLEAFDATAVPSLLLPWLNRSANQIVETRATEHAGKAGNELLRKARSRAGMGIMMANVSNTVQQLTGWLPAALKVKKRHLTRALWNYSQTPGRVAQDVAAMSPFMATRTSTQMADVAEQVNQLLLDPTTIQKVTNFSQRHAYILQSMFQNVVDLVAWQGAFEQAITEGQDYAEAVRAADSTIRETQGSLNPEDVSAWETGSPLKRLFTQFFSYFSAQGNLIGTEMVNAKTLSRAGYVYVVGVMLPAVVSEIIRRSFGAGWDDEDGDGYLDMFLDVFFGSQARYATGALPIAGQLVNLAANQFNDKRFDDQLVPSPVFSATQSAVSAPHSVFKAVTEGKGQKAAVRDTATLMTMLTGVPLFNVVARPLGYLADINEGKVTPTDPVDFARGLVTGTASAASKN